MRKSKPVQSFFAFLPALPAPVDSPDAEFISPLTLKECVRRLRVKRPTRGNRFGFEVIMIKQTPGCYEFRIRRQIVDDFTDMPRQIYAEVSGVLRWWDHGETLVTLKPARKYTQLLWLLPVTGLIFFAIQPTTSVIGGILLLIGALMILATMILTRLSRINANRKLMALLEEMLGDPVLR